MHPNRSSRRVHSAEFKARILAECRLPDTSVSAVAIGHGLNPNVVRKWLAGQGLKRMGSAAHVALDIAAPATTAPALQFVPVKLSRSECVAATPAAQPDIRIELECGGLQVKLQCAASAGAMYAAQLRGLANALCAARGSEQ
jgi:transposase